jgi:hypothetical protein
MVSQKDFLYEINLDIQGIDVISITDILSNQFEFIVTTPYPVLGDKLSIILKNPVMKGKSYDIVITYETNAEQRAVSWNPKENTPSKVFALMYT